MNRSENQAKKGLQKDVKEIFRGVSVPDDRPTARPAHRDAGLDNPMVIPTNAKLLNLRKHHDELEIPLPPPKMSPAKKMLLTFSGLAALILLSLLAYYMITNEAPPMLLVAAMFALYAIGVSIGAIHTYLVSRLRQY